MDCIKNNIEIIKRQNNFICTFKMAYNNTCNSINTGYSPFFISFKKESKIINYTYTKQHKHSNPVPVQLYNYYFLYKVIYNPTILFISTNPNSDNGLMYDGLASTITGGNFLEGAAIGLVVTALNHALHAALDPDPKKQQALLQKKLINRIKELFPDLKLNDYDVIKITVSPDADGNYKTTVEGLFQDKNGKLELAYTSSRADKITGIYDPSTIHISPKLLLKGSDALFKLTIAHELGHAFDNKYYSKFEQQNMIKLHPKFENYMEFRADNFARDRFGQKWSSKLFNHFDSLLKY